MSNFSAPNSFQPESRLSLPKTNLSVPRIPENSLLVSTRNKREKVILQPGHSPLDWASLTANRSNFVKLRGVPSGTPPAQYFKVSKTELKLHNKRDDCWTCINGKVFNITMYVDFHPGGANEIMKGAGRDGTALFNKYHRWVSVDRMLSACFIGFIE